MNTLSKEEKQILMVIGALILLGMVFYGMTHLAGCRKNDTSTVFDMPTGNASIVTMSADVCVHVAGAVLRPGVYTVPMNSRVWEAVLAAGGALSYADLDSVNLSKIVADGERVVVKGQLASKITKVKKGAASASAQKKAKVIGKSRASSSAVNINTATLEELDMLPGVGPALAARIVEYRGARSFVSCADLLKVKGIRKKLFERIQDRLEI